EIMDRDRIGGHARYGCATITIRTTPYVDARGSNETTKRLLHSQRTEPVASGHRLSFRIRASGCTAALHTAGGVRIRARADLWRRSERRIYRNDSGLVDRRWGPVDTTSLGGGLSYN